MKEPLLAAVVANESESSVPNESFDRAAWHSSLLGRACPRIDNQVSFRAKLEEIARGKRGRAWKLELPIESNGYGSVLKKGAECSCPGPVAAVLGSRVHCFVRCTLPLCPLLPLMSYSVTLIVIC